MNTTTDNIATATNAVLGTQNPDLAAQTRIRSTMVQGLSGRTRTAIVSAAAALYTAVPALAQRELTPPQPISGDETAPLIPAMIAAICVGLIIAVNLIPAKRGHQD